MNIWLRKDSEGNRQNVEGNISIVKLKMVATVTAGDRKSNPWV